MTARFNFAWVAANETTFGPEHQREDESVFSFSIDHREGECASLSIELVYPQAALLSAGRYIYAWLSRDSTPLFFGRLVGVPSGKIGASTITLNFIARPADYFVQRRALAESLAVLPIYDRVFIDPDLRIDTEGTGAGTGDVDTVLEAMSARWHVSRGEDGLPLTVTASDILEAEDGTVEFNEDEIEFDTISSGINGAPLSSVKVIGSVNWSQTIDPDSPGIDLGTKYIQTYTGSSLVSGWPKQGQSLGGGWAVKASEARDMWNTGDAQVFSKQFSWQNNEKTHAEGDTMSINYNENSPVLNGTAIQQFLTIYTQAGMIWDGINIPLIIRYTKIYIPLWLVKTSLSITFDVGAKRKEQISFTLYADVQPVLTSPGESESTAGGADQETVSIEGADVGIPIDGVAPLADLTAGNYFPTARGLQSVEYLIYLARAKLRKGSRVVELSWPCTFDKAIRLTCRKAARIYNARLPSGQAEGKIIGYSIKADGSTGLLSGEVTIGCAVGHGGTVSAADGTGLFVEDDALEFGIQQTENDINIPAGGLTDGYGDVGYSVPVAGPEAAFPFSKDEVVLTDEWHGSTSDQYYAIMSVMPALAESARLNSLSNPTISDQQRAHQLAKISIDGALEGKDIWRDLQLMPLDKLQMAYGYDLTVTDLKIPKQIDLESAVTT